jgi:catechol 2,3-dioxygenase-like lactoylglutathione lyase family enzyme
MRVFRVLLEVSSLEKAVAFYARLLDVPARRVTDERAYFDCGPVILGVVEMGARARPNVGYLYLAVDDLEAVHARASSLVGLAPGDVHGAPAGAPAVRPWGERSFYVRDPWGNGLCFVAEGTLFTGHETPKGPKAGRA